MSTRRTEVDGRMFCFDHGTQYFTVRDRAFAAQVDAWQRDGLVARWAAAGDNAFVGTPGMSAPVRALAARHAVAWKTRIEAVEQDGRSWRLIGTQDNTQFDAVIVAVPAEQVAPLLEPHEPDFATIARGTRSAPCWTVMAAFAAPLDIDQVILRRAGAIGWAARDAAKPCRDYRETWVIQASPEWSREHLEETPDDVISALLDQFSHILGSTLPQLLYASAHRWRYARSGNAGETAALWNQTMRLGGCGDWLLGPRVESAWLSGQHAGKLLGQSGSNNS